MAANRRYRGVERREPHRAMNRPAEIRRPLKRALHPSSTATAKLCAPFKARLISAR
jgi:hypothetical protein